MIKRILVLSLSILFVSSSIAKPGQHQDLRKVLNQLELTTEQRQDVRQLMREGRDEKRLFRQDIRDVAQQLRTQIQSEDFDQTAVKTVLQQKSDLMTQLALTRAVKKHQVWQLLSEPQKAKFNDIVAQRQDRQSRKSSKPGFRKLGLSDEQKAKIEQIKAENAEVKAAAKAQRKALKEAQRTLIQAEEFDQEAWQTLLTEYQPQLIENGIIRAQTRHQIWSLLTEEQQAKATKMMQKRMKKAHRKARDTSSI